MTDLNLADKISRDPNFLFTYVREELRNDVQKYSDDEIFEAVKGSMNQDNFALEGERHYVVWSRIYLLKNAMLKKVAANRDFELQAAAYSER